MSNEITQSKITKTAGLMTVVSVCSLAVSFVMESVFAYFFGASLTTDAYTVATQIPITLFALISTAVKTLVIPCYSKEYYSNGPKAAERYASNLTTVIVSISFVFVLLCEIFAKPIVILFAPGMDVATQSLAVQIFRLCVPTVLVTEVMHINTGILNVHKKFILPSLASNILNAAFITSIVLLAGKFGIFAAVIGTIIGTTLEFTYSLLLRRRVMKYHFIMDLKDKSMVKSLNMALPVFIGIGAAEINKVVDRMVSSFLSEGSISTLNYASKLSGAVSTLIITGLTTVIYPEFSKHSANDDDKGMADVFLFALNLLMLLIIPIVFGGTILCKEIIKIVFCRGAFSLETVDRTAPLFACYLVCLLFTAFRQICSRVFYSNGDSKTPMRNSLIGIGLNIVLNVILGYYWGSFGLVLATTISTAVISILLLINVKKRNAHISYRRTRKLFLKAMLASLFMIGLIYLGRKLLVFYGIYDYQSLVANIVFTAGSVLGGALCYFGVLLLLQTEELKSALDFLKRRK